MMRCFPLLVLASAFALAACADDPASTPTPSSPEPVAPAEVPSPPDSTSIVELADPIAATPSEPEAPASPTAPPVAETPDVSPPPSPTPREPTAPEPPRAEPPAEPAPTPPARTDRTAVEAFWTRFQGALRARDAGAIDDYLHTTVRVSGQDYARDGPQVQEVVRQFAENPDLTEAYLDTPADELVVTDGRATFSSVARYTLADEAYEVTVSGVLREVSPGTWRIVELASEPR